MAIKQPYIVMQQEWGRSRHLGTEYVKITFVGVKDRQEYHTYVDTPNRNFKKWQHIINNPEHGFVVRNIKFKTHKGKTLVDADSDVLIEVEELTLDPILNTVQAYWAEEDRKRGTDRLWEIL